MKRKLLFKTIILAAMLCIGTSAWGVDVPTYNSLTGFYELNSVNYYKKTFDFTEMAYGTSTSAAAPIGFSGEANSTHRYQTTFNKSTSKSEIPLGLTFRNTTSNTLYLVLSNYGLQINGTGMYLYVAGIGDGSIAVLNYYVGDGESTTKISDKELQTVAITGEGRSNYFELTTRESYYLYTSVDVYFKATAIGDFTPHADGYYYKADGTKYERTTYDFTSIMRYGDYNSGTPAGFNDTGNRYKTSFTTEKTNMPTGLTFAPSGSGSKQIYYLDLLGMQSDGNVNMYPTARDAYTTAYLYYKTGTNEKVNFADVSESNTSAYGESLSFSLANKNSEYVLYTHMEVFNLVGGSISATTTATGKGWATLYTPYALDFSGVAGLTAYTATVTGNTVTLNPVDDVPANTGVVLKSTTTNADVVNNIPVIASSSTDQGNLEGSATDALSYDANATYNYYMLKLNANNEAQFSKLTSGTIAAGKAYLKIAKNNAPAMFNVVFANETTGINNVNRETITNNRYFDLQGRKVANPTKGLYIVNGKKVIIK